MASNMLEVMIIDDMPLAIANLKAECEDNHPEIHIVDTANGVMDAAKKIKKHQPDLIFLDIHMGDGDGFDLLEMITREGIEVIFTTASKDHAIKAFQYKAADYLLKPVDPDLLSQAIDKILTRKNNRTRTDESKYSYTIALNTQEELRIVNKKDIIRLESMGNYTNFFLSDNSKVLVTKTMKEYVNLLGDDFLRVHQSHHVNISQIKAYVKTEGGYLLMKNDDQVPVSLRKKSMVMEVLSNV